jgi:hypothetical protein
VAGAMLGFQAPDEKSVRDCLPIMRPPMPIDPNDPAFGAVRDGDRGVTLAALTVGKGRSSKSELGDLSLGSLSVCSLGVLRRRAQNRPPRQVDQSTAPDRMLRRGLRRV